MKADRFDVLERADHLKGRPGSRDGLRQKSSSETPKTTSTVFLGDDTGYISMTPHPRSTGAFMAACDRMLDAQIEAAE